MEASYIPLPENLAVQKVNTQPMLAIRHASSNPGVPQRCVLGLQHFNLLTRAVPNSAQTSLSSLLMTQWDSTATIKQFMSWCEEPNLNENKIQALIVDFRKMSEDQQLFFVEGQQHKSSSFLQNS